MSRDPQRYLASDARAGTYARRKARTDQRQYVRKNWRWLAGTYVALVAVGTAPLLLGDDAFWLGLWLGLWLAGVAGLIVITIVIQTGTGPTMAGELAEQWTAQELRPLNKHGYRLANHVSVDNRGDADHVLIGPGGLFVLETKWSATQWNPEDRFFLKPLQQIQDRARNTWLQLKPHGVSQATPVLVLWGKAARELSEGPGVRRKDGVFVVAGPHLRRWLLARPAGALTDAQVDPSYQTVCTISARADKREAPVPASVQAIFVWSLAAVPVAMAALVVSLWTLRWGLGWFAFLVSGLLLAGLTVSRRWQRLLGAASAAGAGLALLITAAAVAYAYAVAA